MGTSATLTPWMVTVSRGRPPGTATPASPTDTSVPPMLRPRETNTACRKIEPIRCSTYIFQGAMTHVLEHSEFTSLNGNVMIHPLTHHGPFINPALLLEVSGTRAATNCTVLEADCPPGVRATTMTLCEEPGAKRSTSKKICGPGPPARY